MMWIGIGLFIWIFLLILFCTPSSTWSRLSRGKFAEDRVPLQMVLDHLISAPEDWSVNREGAAFPKEGTKQVYINRDRKTGELTYSLASFGERERLMNGYHAHLFAKALTDENNRREKESLMRQFHPQMSEFLMLK